MATHASADKAARQAIRKGAENRSMQTKYRNAIKKIRAALILKYDSKDVAKKTLTPLLNETQALLMRAASKNVIKANTASRQVSRLSLAIHKATM